MNEAQIEKIILNTAGNPTVGAVKDLAPQIAAAIAAELEPKRESKPKRETRVVLPDETR